MEFDVLCKEKLSKLLFLEIDKDKFINILGVDSKNINIDELVKENTQLKNKNIELEKQKENFVNETKSLTDTVNVLKGLNNRMANSASWKITKPLRWIRRKF